MPLIVLCRGSLSDSISRQQAVVSLSNTVAIGMFTATFFLLLAVLVSLDYWNHSATQKAIQWQEGKRNALSDMYLLLGLSGKSMTFTEGSEKVALVAITGVGNRRERYNRHTGRSNLLTLPSSRLSQPSYPPQYRPATTGLNNSMQTSK